MWLVVSLIEVGAASTAAPGHSPWGAAATQAVPIAGRSVAHLHGVPTVILGDTRRWLEDLGYGRDD